MAMSAKHIDIKGSRRAFLKAGAGLAAGAVLPATASAQGGQGTDPELARLQSRPGDEFIHLLHMPAEPLQIIKDSGCHVSLSTGIEMTMGQQDAALRITL
jgi:hypothetical protein